MSDVTTRAMDWLHGRDTGLSSKALFTVMMGGTKRETTDYPRDPADIGQCFRLLELVPEWKTRLHEMKACGDVWSALVDRWDEIRQSMEDEAGIDWSKSNRAKRTYGLMRSIIDPIEKQRRSAYQKVPAMTPTQEQRLRAALSYLPGGFWEVWTSNSYRRITAVDERGRHGPDGGFLHATKQRDGHPDLSIGERELAALCELRNTVAEILNLD